MSDLEFSTNAEWFGPGARPRTWRDFRLSRFLLAMVIPPKGQKVVPTKAGLVLIVLALSIGVAAYNTSSNILFIALSLLDRREQHPDDRQPVLVAGPHCGLHVFLDLCLEQRHGQFPSVQRPGSPAGRRGTPRQSYPGCSAWPPACA